MVSGQQPVPDRYRRLPLPLPKLMTGDGDRYLCYARAPGAEPITSLQLVQRAGTQTTDERKVSADAVAILL